MPVVPCPRKRIALPREPPATVFPDLLPKTNLCNVPIVPDFGRSPGVLSREEHSDATFLYGDWHGDPDRPGLDGERPSTKPSLRSQPRTAHHDLRVPTVGQHPGDGRRLP